eukprot:1316618-Amphidinium_carterae.2
MSAPRDNEILVFQASSAQQWRVPKQASISQLVHDSKGETITVQHDEQSSRDSHECALCSLDKACGV